MDELYGNLGQIIGYDGNKQCYQNFVPEENKLFDIKKMNKVRSKRAFLNDTILNNIKYCIQSKGSQCSPQ